MSRDKVSIPKPLTGRGGYALNQKRVVMDDKRTKRVRTRAAKKRAALRDSY
ncbi:MAG: hypothetical protein M3141_10650 [Actinomycetota bacterium]|nr:hypothetical protein [Actinomycetota bacterium]